MVNRVWCFPVTLNGRVSITLPTNKSLVVVNCAVLGAAACSSAGVFVLTGLILGTRLVTIASFGYFITTKKES